MDGFETYKLYVALKNHFNSDTYDFFRYGGKTRASGKSFDVRHDKYFFIKLAKHKDPQRYILANIVEDNANVWVGDLVNEQKAEENYREWLKRQESMTYIFKQDLEALNEDFNKNIVVEGNKHPLLLQMLIHKRVSIETVVILNELCPFFKYWTRNIEEDVIWPMYNKKCRKYRPFLKIEKEKFKQIVVDKFRIVE